MSANTAVADVQNPTWKVARSAADLTQQEVRGEFGASSILGVMATAFRLGLLD